MKISLNLANTAAANRWLVYLWIKFRSPKSSTSTSLDQTATRFDCAKCINSFPVFKIITPTPQACVFTNVRVTAVSEWINKLSIRVRVANSCNRFQTMPANYFLFFSTINDRFLGGLAIRRNLCERVVLKLLIRATWSRFGCG